MTTFDSHKHYQKAVMMLEQSDDVEGALNELVRILCNDVNLPEALLLWTKLSLRTGGAPNDQPIDFESLEKSLSGILEQEPDIPEAYLARAICWYVLAEKHAIECAKEVIEASAPRNLISTIWTVLSSRKNAEKHPSFKLVFEKYERMKSDATRALNLRPGLPEAFVVRSIAYTGLKDTSSANEDLQLAIDHGYEVDIDGDKWILPDKDSSKSIKLLGKFNEIIAFLSFPISITSLMPVCTSIAWQGSVLALLGWSVIFFMAYYIYRLCVVGTIILVYWLKTPEEQRSKSIFLELGSNYKAIVLSAVADFFAGSLTFFNVTFFMDSTVLMISSLEERLLASLVVGISVMIIRTPITLLNYCLVNGNMSKISRK